MRDDASQIIETIQGELEKQLFQMRNLVDISRELYQTTDFQQVLADSLLMIMGSFGARSAFVLTQGDSDEPSGHFLTRGLSDKNRAAIREAGRRLLENWDKELSLIDVSRAEHESMKSEDIAVLLPFQVEDSVTGLLGLGPKLSEEFFYPQDKELIEIMGRNLAIALRYARSFQRIEQVDQRLTEQSVRMEGVTSELDRKVFHLKTLFHVSKGIFGSVKIDEILRRFLLLTVGNFGAFRGFVLLAEAPFSDITSFESVGYKDDIMTARRGILLKALQHWQESQRPESTYLEGLAGDACLRVLFGLPFNVDENCIGLLGLGPKLNGDEFTGDDRELLETLVNNLGPALSNARAFENIQRLNLDLQETNRQLSITLEELRAALRKVEILEDVKSNLSKFVPTTVTRMIEASPGTNALEARERDVSVLFLDIEGYTLISQRLDPLELNRLIERYFSVFMDAIYENRGDVNETAGDGLMVLFLGEDQIANACDAVRTALSICEKTTSISTDLKDAAQAVVVNMGISSGPAYVGAVKFESLTGSRWTYTSRGMTTNLAARICACATSGQVLVCRETAERIKDQFPCCSLGNFALKNISEEMEIFSVLRN